MNDSNNDKYYINRCKVLIEEKLSWRPSSEWRNYEFIELSGKIFDQTGINLSITTLKRIFGKIKYDNLPSSVTLNALSNFLGYASWMEFKFNQTNYADKTNEQSAHRPGIPQNRGKIVKTKAAFTIAALGLIIGSGFIFLKGKSSGDKFETENIIFKSRSLANGFPNTVVFNVDLKGIKSDNIIIQQYWDSTKTIRLKTGQKEATGIYFMPGYFRARLIVDGKVLKEHDLFLKAETWIATVDQKPIPTYIDKNKMIFDKRLDIAESELEAIKKSTAPAILTYHLVKQFPGFQSDNFIFETAIKNTYGEGYAICKTSKIFILGTKGAFIIPFSIPGCVSELNLKLNYNYLPGTSNDLSSFGTNLSEWSKVKLEVKNRVAKIFLNGNLIRQESYLRDAGEIAGLRFSFLGAGTVDYVRITNGNEKSSYIEEFDDEKAATAKHSPFKKYDNGKK